MLVDNIRSLCKEKGISLLKLETDCGFSNGTINKWDVNVPSVHKVMTVAKYFSVTVDDLLHDNKQEGSED